MTSGLPADRRQTDPYTTVYGPSGRQKAGHGQHHLPGLPAADGPDGAGPAEAHPRGRAASPLPPDWEARAEAMIAHDRIADALRLVKVAMDNASNGVVRAAAVRGETAAMREAIQRDRLDYEREKADFMAERARFEAERDVLARQRVRLAQDRKAFEAEVRDVARLRDELMRREAVLREAAARKGRRTQSEPLPVIDDHGAVLRPDPSTATNPRQFMEALRQYRRWAGNPSYRVMSDRVGGHPVASTIQTMLARNELPTRLEAVDAVIRGCGGTPEDRQKFATAWRLLTL